MKDRGTITNLLTKAADTLWLASTGQTGDENIEDLLNRLSREIGKSARRTRSVEKALAGGHLKRANYLISLPMTFSNT